MSKTTMQNSADVEAFLRKLIELNRCETLFAHIHSSITQGICQERGTTNRRVGGKNDMFYATLGKEAELAFGKKFNKRVAWDMDPDPGIDFWFGDISVDVKATHHPAGCLMVPIVKGPRELLEKHEPDKLKYWKMSPAQWFVLMTGQDGAYTYQGAMAAADVFNEENIDSRGRGPTYIVPQKKLHLLDLRDWK